MASDGVQLRRQAWRLSFQELSPRNTARHGLIHVASALTNPDLRRILDLQSEASSWLPWKDCGFDKDPVGCDKLFARRIICWPGLWGFV
jgi:hypothetical protein